MAILMRLNHERRSDVAEVGPLTCAEREKWLCKMKASRPGPSGWKLYYLRLFPEWVQDIFWTMLDVQRLRAIVVPCIKAALQVNLAKAKGGWRLATPHDAGVGVQSYRRAHHAALFPGSIPSSGGGSVQ